MNNSCTGAKADLKLNCHTHSSPLQRGNLPSASEKVSPSWISFNMSTLHLCSRCCQSACLHSLRLGNTGQGKY